MRHPRCVGPNDARKLIDERHDLRREGMRTMALKLRAHPAPVACAALADDSRPESVRADPLSQCEQRFGAHQLDITTGAHVAKQAIHTHLSFGLGGQVAGAGLRFRQHIADAGDCHHRVSRADLMA